ncbi:PAS domain S-box protein [Desulfobacterales bacterium HSG16]|nr:PAS domain S-box protein [Desulfobacterales bacterium HSG16]
MRQKHKLTFRILTAVIAVLAIIFFWNWQIRRREEHFRGLTEHGMARILTQAFKKDGTIVYRSPSHKAILGYDTDELVGRQPVERTI